jgi:hypothetical protein
LSNSRSARSPRLRVGWCLFLVVAGDTPEINVIPPFLGRAALNESAGEDRALLATTLNADASGHEDSFRDKLDLIVLDARAFSR